MRAPGSFKQARLCQATGRCPCHATRCLARGRRMRQLMILPCPKNTRCAWHAAQPLPGRVCARVGLDDDRWSALSPCVARLGFPQRVDRRGRWVGLDLQALVRLGGRTLGKTLGRRWAAPGHPLSRLWAIPVGRGAGVGTRGGASAPRERRSGLSLQQERSEACWEAKSTGDVVHRHCANGALPASYIDVFRWRVMPPLVCPE